MAKPLSLNDLLAEVNAYLEPKKPVIASRPPRRNVFPPRARLRRQVLFYRLDSCRCGETYTYPEHDGVLFTCELGEANSEVFTPCYGGRDVSLPFETRYTRRELALCPACAEAPHVDETCKRMFRVPEPQLSLNYERWLHAPSAFPLVPLAQAVLPRLYYPKWLCISLGTDPTTCQQGALS